MLCGIALQITLIIAQIRNLKPNVKLTFYLQCVDSLKTSKTLNSKKDNLEMTPGSIPNAKLPMFLVSHTK